MTNQQPSFEQFDYRLRPAKHAERKMLAEAFLRLLFFTDFQNYRYIGFGATTFSDFILFHKILNLKKMISIEANEELKNRFEFNKPFEYVSMEYGKSSDVLARLPWEQETIIWLDYDGKFDEVVIQDLGHLVATVQSGSVVLVSFPVHGNTYAIDSGIDEAEKLKLKLKMFTEDIGKDKVPPGLTGKNLEASELIKTCRLVLSNQIDAILESRNLGEGSKYTCQQLFNFVYRDGIRMLTLGWVFYKDEDEEKFAQCNFDDLEFVRKNEHSYRIRVPAITPRERHYLNKIIPSGDLDAAVKEIGLPKKDAEDYISNYRFLPIFADTEMT